MDHFTYFLSFSPIFRSSGDMKYADETYFTEGEETGKASASGFGESYTEGDTSANEAQG